MICPICDRTMRGVTAQYQMDTHEEVTRYVYFCAPTFHYMSYEIYRYRSDPCEIELIDDRVFNNGGFQISNYCTVHGFIRHTICRPDLIEKLRPLLQLYNINI